jgi:hypothetical protein
MYYILDPQSPCSKLPYYEVNIASEAARSATDSSVFCRTTTECRSICCEDIRGLSAGRYIGFIGPVCSTLLMVGQNMFWRVGNLLLALALLSTEAFVLPQRVATTSMHPRTLPKGETTAPARAASTPTTLFGIPKMFRWLTDQYPDILSRQLEEGLQEDLAIDNFYLDMNGIIHPATHGNNNDEIIVLDETAMFKKIFLYVDRIYKLVRPRKVLYLAVDGVAPRAKMNQQRSRRFRSAKEAEQLAGELLARNGKLDTTNRFDSNCITPGTDFMLKLSLAMQKWVAFKMET